MPFDHPELAEAMMLCVSCKGCRRECENEVDMALIKAEFMAQRFSHSGLPLRQCLFAHLPVLLAAVPFFRRLIYWSNHSTVLAKLSGRLLSISAKMQLPMPVKRAFQFECFGKTKFRLIFLDIL